MRFNIPVDKVDIDNESTQILRATSGAQGYNVNAALGFIIENAGDNHIYNEGDFDKLYKIYGSLGLTYINSKTKAKEELFPNRNAETFKYELQKLWRGLELYSLGEDNTILDSFLKFENENAKYEELLRQRENKELNNDKKNKDIQQQWQSGNVKAEIGQHPIADVYKGSKIYFDEYFKDTAYEELSNRWDAFKNNLNTEVNRTHSLLEQDISHLLSLLQPHYIRHNSMGSYVPMTEGEYQEINRLYHECVKDISRLEDKANSPEYIALQEMLIHNELQLSGLHMDNLPPLADVISNEISETIQLEDIENKSVGANLSDRAAIEYTGKDGRVRRGFFTENKQLKHELYGAEQITERYIANYPKFEHLFRRFFNPDTDNPFYPEIINAAKARQTNDMYALHKLAQRYSKKFDVFDDYEEFQTAFLKYAEELRKNQSAYSVMTSSGIQKDDYIAERAGAMSDIASALGVPELLASSRKVTVKRGDKEISGVFIETATEDSVDRQYLTKDHPFLKTNRDEFSNRNMLESLADLQIIDYLCANTDRHANNFFVRQDFSDPSHPRLVGVQGIDNDNSFGKLYDGGIMQMASASNLKIITPKMAKAVSHMTVEQLKSILKGYHLSELQMDAAIIRLERLQKMIAKGSKDSKLKIDNGKLINEEGTIHIVKDAEWKDLNLDSLVPRMAKKQNSNEEFQPKNIFYIASYIRDDIEVTKNKLSDPNNMDAPKAPIAYTCHKMQIDYNKLAYQQGREIDALEKIKTKFEKNGGLESSRSSKFKKMYSELNKLIEAYKGLEKITLSENEDFNKKEAKVTEYYKALTARRSKLKLVIDTYLNKTHFRDISKRNQLRINNANGLNEIVKNIPISENIFKDEKKLQNQYALQMQKMNTHQLNSYVSNQIYSMMHDTLLKNVQKININDEKHSLGLNALKAQERLWKYAMTDGSDHNAANKDVIKKDLEVIKRYEPKLNDQINAILGNEVSPHEVRKVLQNLLLYGTTPVNKNIDKKTSFEKEKYNAKREVKTQNTLKNS